MSHKENEAKPSQRANPARGSAFVIEDRLVADLNLFAGKTIQSDDRFAFDSR